jgi:hypothetical protein
MSPCRFLVRGEEPWVPPRPRAPCLRFYLLCLAGTLAALTEKQQTFVKKVPPRCPAGSTAKASRERRDLIKMLSCDFWHAACKLCDDMVEAAGAEDVEIPLCWCYKCEKLCSPVPELGSRDIWLEVAGNTCTPWSRAGSQLGWLDEASLPALAWGFSLRHAKPQPHAVVNECTPDWPAVQFLSYFLPGYRLRSIRVSPDDIGIPSHRPRLYTTAASQDMTVELSRLDKLFLSSALRGVTQNGTIFFCAPEDVVESTLRNALRSRGLVPPADGVTKMSWQMVLGFGARQRLKGYKELRSIGKAGIICNLSNNSSYSSACNDMVPTLLKNSFMYHLLLKRPLLPVEHFAVNGVPLFLQDCDEDLIAVPQGVFLSMTPSCARALSGNMMNIPVVGSIIAAVLLAHTFKGELLTDSGADA